MEREAKTKVVTSVCGADFVQFLAALSVLPRSIWKNMMNSTVSSKPAEANLPIFFIISSFFVSNVGTAGNSVLKVVGSNPGKTKTCSHIFIIINM